MRISIAVVVIFLLVTRTHAQEVKPAEKPHRYFNLFQSGALLAEKDKGTSFTFSTYHGLQFNTMRVALGSGYDSYQRWKVLPINAMFAIDLAKIKENALYLAVSGGYCRVWQRKLNEFDAIYDADDGVNVSPTLGYRILADKWNINFSVGYKYQRINYTYTSYSWYGAYVGQPVYSVDEALQRMVVQIGFGLN
jgi:hypothetical protein